MFALEIKQDDNGVYSLSFSTTNQEMVMKYYDMMLKESINSKPAPKIALANSIQEYPKEIEIPIKDNVIPFVSPSIITTQNVETTLPEEKLNQCVMEEECVTEMSQEELDKCLAEHMEEQHRAEEKTEEQQWDEDIQKLENEKQAKRRAFYQKFLFELMKESNAVFSLLSNGVPIGSNGTTLIINLPDNIYNTFMDDKRCADVVSVVLEKVAPGKNIKFEFRKIPWQSLENKLAQQLGAEYVGTEPNKEHYIPAQPIDQQT